MASSKVHLRFDVSAAVDLLAGLAEVSSEIRDAVLRFLYAGEELFLFESDDFLTRRTGEMVVRHQPTDRLLGLLPATGAGNCNGGVVKHPDLSLDVASSGAVLQQRSAPFPASAGIEQDPGAAGHPRQASPETGAEPTQLRPFSRLPSS